MKRPMNTKPMKLLLASGLLSLSLSAMAIDMVLNEKAVNVPLPVGKEIIVKFPQAVTHTEVIDGETDKLRQLLRPDGVLMLEAGEAFGEARLIATQLDGNIVVLDLDAQIGAINHETINLVHQRLKKPKPKIPPKVKKTQVTEKNPYKPDFLRDGASMTKSEQTTHNVGFKNMVQYGFRYFVAPRRLIGDVSAQSVNVNRQGLKHWVRVWGNQLSIKPLKQWKIHDRYLTVLLVNNLSNQAVAFDPRALRGRLVFAAALQPTLAPSGGLDDQTLWAVITAVPFNQAIR